MSKMTNCLEFIRTHNRISHARGTGCHKTCCWPFHSPFNTLHSIWVRWDVYINRKHQTTFMIQKGRTSDPHRRLQETLSISKDSGGPGRYDMKGDYISKRPSRANDSTVTKDTGITCKKPNQISISDVQHSQSTKFDNVLRTSKTG